VLIVAVLLTSCESFLDVNDDPNNPTAVTPDLILPVAQKIYRKPNSLMVEVEELTVLET
jgi:hypothetical protein